ncbi:MAG: hypothetical protein LBI57_03900, partial [Helicobacteraceae bacterium]|nr:hypothetical protein [Helicobacteraceae bacterium]
MIVLLDLLKNFLWLPAMVASRSIASASRFFAITSRFYAIASRSIASRVLAVLTLALLPASPILADDRIPLPFDENSWIVPYAYYYGIQAFSIPSNLIDETSTSSPLHYRYRFNLVIKEFPSFPVFQFSIVLNSNNYSGASVDAYRYDLPTANGIDYEYKSSYGNGGCPSAQFTSGHDSVTDTIMVSAWKNISVTPTTDSMYVCSYIYYILDTNYYYMN